MRAKYSKTLLGQTVDSWTKDNTAARQIEDLLVSNGNNFNKGKGVDLPDDNLEVKSRLEESRSPHTVSGMTENDIINTPYKQSRVYQKLQKQMRVKHTCNKVVKVEYYDFSQPHIQDILEEAYEEARESIKAGCTPYAPGTKYGYFEYKSSNTYSFRIPHKAMQELEAMAKSSFGTLFEYD